MKATAVSDKVLLFSVLSSSHALLKGTVEAYLADMGIPVEDWLPTPLQFDLCSVQAFTGMRDTAFKGWHGRYPELAANHFPCILAVAVPAKNEHARMLARLHYKVSKEFTESLATQLTFPHLLPLGNIAPLVSRASAIRILYDQGHTVQGMVSWEVIVEEEQAQSLTYSELVSVRDMLKKGESNGE